LEKFTHFPHDLSEKHFESIFYVPSSLDIEHDNVDNIELSSFTASLLI